MNEPTIKGILIFIVVLAMMIVFILCAIWHHVSAMRYRKLKNEKGRQYKWYQLFGKLNEIGFWVKFIAVVLFSLTIFISLHYLCTTYPHILTKTPDFDYMAIICTFFGVLVTLLVGWNIYNVIDFKNKMAKLDEGQDYLGEVLIATQNSLSKTKATTLRLLSQALATELFASSEEKKLTLILTDAIGSMQIFISDEPSLANAVLDEILKWTSMAQKHNILLPDKYKRQLIRQLDKSDLTGLMRIDELRDYLDASTD